MKKILILFAASMLSFSSCKDFLTVIPVDAMFMDDVKALKQALGSFLYVHNTWGIPKSGVNVPTSWHWSYMEVKYLQYSDVWTFPAYQDLTSLNEEQKRILSHSLIDRTDWSRYYAIIGYLNLILAEIDEAGGDEEDMRNYVKGEALVQRAFSFFKLLQYYAPMDDASLGIPVYLDVYGGFDDADLSRRSHRYVYDRILSDLKEAERLLGITAPRTSYNKMYSYGYVYRTMAKVYRWKALSAAADEDDWANAEEAATKDLNHSSPDAMPLSIDQFESCVGGKGNNMTYMAQEFLEWKDQGIVGYMSYAMMQNFSFGYDPTIFSQLYMNSDRRRTEWFSVSSTGSVTLQKYGYTGSFYQVLFPLSESYLIKVEAYANMGDFNLAKEAFDKWLELRYNADQRAAWPNPTSLDALKEEILLERKREYIQDWDTAWLDLKSYRQTTAPREAAGFRAPGLAADDIRYQFRIPDSETETNTTIRRNPGWEAYMNIDDVNQL